MVNGTLDLYFILTLHGQLLFILSYFTSELRYNLLIFVCWHMFCGVQCCGFRGGGGLFDPFKILESFSLSHTGVESKTN